MSRSVSSFCVLVLLAGCASTAGPARECVLRAPATEVLAQLLAHRWDDIDPENVADLWPESTSWGSRAQGEADCSGTVTFSHLGYVLDNDCLCCDVFGFSDVKIGASCLQRLSSITLVRHAGSRRLAEAIGARLLSVVSPAEPALSGSTATRVRYVEPDVQEVTSVAIMRSRDGWVVRMMVYRVDFAVAEPEAQGVDEGGPKDLDTLGGSSGAPILSLAGEIVGVHTNGGCFEFGGVNYGTSIGIIREASAIIRRRRRPS